MNFTEALPLAQSLAQSMRPFCERVEIAGSIRRKKPSVKDIEIVAIPKWETQPCVGDLFSVLASEQVNLLYNWAQVIPNSIWPDVEPGGIRPNGVPKVQWIKPGTQEIIPWAVKPDGSYWRGYLPDHAVKLDLFLTTPDKWASILLIRTGSAQFSEGIVTYARRVGFRFHEGRLYRGMDLDSAEVVPVSEEADVFAALGLRYVDPAQRYGPEEIRESGQPLYGQRRYH